MATYADYLAAIDGKTFGYNSLYVAQSFSQNTSSVNGIASYSGSAAGIKQATNFSGTAASLNTTTGTFTLGGSTWQVHGASVDGNDLFFMRPDGQGELFLISNTQTAPTGTVTFGTSNSYKTPNPTCFVRGTRILTRQGEVAIEALQPGDLIITEDGRKLPVKWIGHRAIDCRNHPWPELMNPIEIAAGAIADNVPLRTMKLSPSHAVLVDPDWIMNAGDLVNGTSIRQVGVDHVEYWHVELDEHAIIIADGLPAESFVDVGNRCEFDNGGPYVVLHPKFVATALDGYCAQKIEDPFVRSYFRDKFAARAADHSAIEKAA
jgi:hypothetical protein